MDFNKVIIRNTEVLADDWSLLKKITFDYKKKDGNWETQSRETYDRGDGAVILLYNTSEKKVILTRQFRLTTYLNGNSDGMLIEACAGKLENDNPEVCIKKEVLEETGYTVSNVEKIFDAYTTPGSVTEILYFFIAEYDHKMKTDEGGGLVSEQEYIEVLEYDFEKALQMIATGEIRDAKTIMLLQYLKIQNRI